MIPKTFQFTGALAHFEGAPGAKSFVDDAGKTWTGRGGAVLANNPKFGSTAGGFDGAVNSAWITNGADLAFGTNDYTIEGQVYFPAVPGAQLNFFSTAASGTTGNAATDVLIYYISNTLRVWTNNGDRISMPFPAAGAYHHLAVTRQNTVLRMFIDGIKAAADSTDAVNHTSQYFYVGSLPTSLPVPAAMRIDEVRITNGRAWYTSNFTPPAAPFVYVPGGSYIQPNMGPADFIGARAAGPDQDNGGIALNDASQGLLARIWRASSDGSHISLYTDGVLPTVIVTDSGISYDSFSFDQNMNPVIAYIADGVAKLSWFNINTNTRVTTVLGTDVVKPRVFLDDKHPLASGTSDVIVAYLRGSALYFRAQRDNYATEYVLAANVASRGLENLGMNAAGRLQFRLRGTY